MTIFLVRHGSAGHRNDSDPNDLDRHLDSTGLVQAERLAAVFSGAEQLTGLGDLGVPAVERVWSSPAARCVETIEPTASRLGVSLSTSPHLLEGADIDGAWELIESLARESGDSVMCSHGDMIPELIRRARLRGMLVPTKSGCSKGSVWALSRDGDRFISGSYATTR